MTKKEKVAVIGMGYVGFPLACAVAKSGKYDVIGYDVDSKKVNKINKNVSPVEDRQAEEDIKNISFVATTEDKVLGDAKFILICVPTPIDEDKNPDLTPVVKATESIAKYLKSGMYIVLESTVNPGVCEEVMLPILEKTGLKGGVDFELAHCPERINPGDSKYNVYNIPRNVGALTREGAKVIADFYRSILHASVREVSSIKVAEATKIFENTFRDVNIALVNFLAVFCDSEGIDSKEVVDGASSKPFSFMPHFAGCGVGGHCIPVDPYYLIERAQGLGVDATLLKTARNVNNNMPKYTVQKLVSSLRALGIDIAGKDIGLLGLSYKANIGDMRESPALEIRKELQKLGANVKSYDPHCNGHSDSLLKDIHNCVGVILATNHSLFNDIDEWGDVKVIVDGRNCLNKEKIEAKKIIYRGIGRGD